MKFLTRIKGFASNSIVAKIQIRKNSKSDNTFLFEGLTKDGSFIREYQEGFPYNEVKKVVDFFDGKMKRCAWTTFFNYGETVENDGILFVNPELMEKERVGFEFYGPVSARNANADIKAYYSFADDGNDFRQEINNGDIYGFFRFSNFESDGGFKANLNDIGITYVLLDNTANTYMFLSMAEYKRQFKKDEIPEPKKTFKNESKLPKEIKDALNAFKKAEESKKEQSDDEVKSEEIISTTESKKSRGRPAKKQEEEIKSEPIIETVVETPVIKRGRGRPPKVKEN